MSASFEPYGLTYEQVHGFKLLLADEVEQIVARQRREHGPFYDGGELISNGVHYRVFEGRITRHVPGLGETVQALADTLTAGFLALRRSLLPHDIEEPLP
jgi:hypothetical protein